MSVTLRKDILKIKDPSSGTYREAALFGTDLPGEAEAIVAEATASMNAAAANVQSEVDDIVDGARSDIDEIAQTVASMASLGTDTTLTTSGMAADAQAAGDALRAIKNAITYREDSGVASRNYVSGSLIFVGDNLYEATSSITIGESITAGANCTATTISAQIAYIKSIANGISNVAYLGYEIVT